MFDEGTGSFARHGPTAATSSALDAARPGKVVYLSTIGAQATHSNLLSQHHSIVELEGPHRVTPNEIAATLANLLGRPVRVEVVPRQTWESLFKSQGMRNPTPRIQMLDGFNEGRIEFQGGHAGPRKGNVTLETVLRTLIERESKL